MAFIQQRTICLEGHLQKSYYCYYQLLLTEIQSCE